MTGRVSLSILPPDGGGSARSDGERADLGVLSIHLDGARCRVGCEFCYLGERVDSSDHSAAARPVEVD
jgi:hypothetical protein